MDHHNSNGSAPPNGALLPSNMTDPSFATTQSLITYLRQEADLAEDKAKRLRAQAAALSQKFNISDEMQSQYELQPNELPPVDEHGMPKYKGKKRGRKPKPRKRKVDPSRGKRKHTGYTLFVEQNYPSVKTQHPELQSKEVISIVARQWKEGLTADQKREWKERAKATHDETNDEDDEEEPENSTAGDHDHHPQQPQHHLAVGSVGLVENNDENEAKATAVADALYQQTVVRAMAANEGVGGEDEEAEDDDDEITEEHQEDDEELEGQAVEEDDDEEEEAEIEEPPTSRRRSARTKKA